MKLLSAAGLLFLLISNSLSAQTAEELIASVKQKMDKVNDYEATGKMKTNVIFIKAPVANVKVFFKKPNKLRIKNENGISFVPKGAVNINLANVFDNTGQYDIIDMGKEKTTGFRVIKLLPQNDDADIVLSTLTIDEKTLLIKKAKTTTKDNGTYELDMTYGKYADYGLADKITFSFNTKDYKLPKGVTFDYDDGTKKQNVENKMADRKGKVEIVYSSYSINKGLADTIFQ